METKQRKMNDKERGKNLKKNENVRLVLTLKTNEICVVFTYE